MDPQLLRKIVEIVVDKVLIGLFILIAGALLNSAINRGLEKYKLIEAQRISDTSEVVKACGELWARAYEYEGILQEVDTLKLSIWIWELPLTIESPEIVEKKEKNKKKVVGLEQLTREKFEEFSKAMDQRRFIIGELLEQHYWSYISLVKSLAQMQDQMRTDKEPKPQEYLEAIKDLDKQIRSMRFTALAAREFAISTIPR